ncbi:PH domain-containing protein [uncultured Pseudokineococcus sp.]|uniref:PH domain-containing protein n=1 Tax=uncultured Pseudokineococcus sp. TaxID=1642928 RepID=UPI002631F365|nr:PH domain-containing protein [uncultured Pseudokineococcus sp.]
MAARADDGVFDPQGVEWTRVSPRLATVRRIGSAVGHLVMLVPAVVLALVLDRTWILLLWLPFGVMLVVAQVLIGRQVAAIGYAEREDDLLVREGLLFRTLVVVPYGRMQYVDVSAGPVDRRFGIATVQLHTASAGTDATIPGLPPADAERLRDRLASRGEARLAGL